jgi:peptidoglycan-N-acetylglucosamine deacetylase
MITEHGHEVGNHSFNHESWLQSYSRDEIEKEITLAENAIIEATGQKPIGFRGPGFSWSYDLLEVLAEKAYVYDASTLPTFIGPLARMYYFWKSDLSKEEKKDRKELFGSFSLGFKKLKPYYHKMESGKQLLEIPVTTIPIVKVPFHLSYLLYISGISMFLMRVYLGFAILMCRLTRTRPSFLLHPLDIIGGDQVKELAFFPGMNISSERKVKVFKIVLKSLAKHYNLSYMSEQAKCVSKKS